MQNLRSRKLRAKLLAAAALMIPAIAQAQETIARPDIAEDTPGIVGRNGLDRNTPAPAGLLDTSGINGVGQMRTITDLTTRAGFVCTGTLINPRTVIFAAHCVNDRAASAYGYTTGGTPISFGFQSDNLVARRLWAGISADGTTINPIGPSTFRTNVGNAIYSVENVWYDPRSLLPANASFINSDIAIATLDTPAEDIPTWAMLFTPLTGETHGVITGYGSTGTSGTSGANVGIDSRRRIAENMVSFLGSLDDRNNFLFCPGSTSCPFNTLPQSLYQLDFDNPAGQGVGFNFDLFDGPALPNEGSTAGGDSGGPLIVDQKFNRKVIVGTLSGGSRFFGAQPFSSYGTSSFYQPLFLYWDLIVANNPYKYVNNLSGDRDWTNPAHWVQAMDPNYVVERNGQLVNALPGSLGLETSTNTTKFGKVCFLNDCLDVTRTGPENAGTGAGLVVPGGPGSTNFVPNNVRANPQLGIKPRYYDVTLSAAGTTKATTAIEIDRLTINGPTKLDVASSGNLRVLTDFTQLFGWTNVDGTLKTGEALVATGILSGSGLIDPTFLTVGKAFVVPGGDGTTGTLTIRGDLILTSATTLYFDAARGAADKIVVVGDAQNPGIASLGGTLYFQKNGAAPRHGESFEVLTATGGVQNTFGEVLGKQGVLRPTLAYGPKTVTVTLFAGQLTDQLLSKGTVEHAFAATLDSLRASSYTKLHGLYGAIDVMNPAQLSATLRGLNPTVVGETSSLARFQADELNMLLANRLNRLGTARSGGGRLDIVGSPGTLLQLASGSAVNSEAIAQRGLIRGLTPGASLSAALPETMSGFISGNVERTRASSADDAVRGISERANWNFAMGLESQVSDRFTFGGAVGFAQGRANLAGASTRIRTTQAAAYANYRLSSKAYVAGLATVAQSRVGIGRSAFNGESTSQLNGDATAVSYTVHAETGVNLPIARGLTLTPHASLRYTNFSIDRLHETGGELALRLSDIGEERLEGRVGIALDGTHKSHHGWSVSPQVSAEYVRRLAGNGGTLTARFDLADAVAFNLPFGSQDGQWGELKAGVKFVNGPVSIGAGVETSVGRSDYRDDRAVADMTVRF